MKVHNKKKVILKISKSYCDWNFIQQPIVNIVAKILEFSQAKKKSRIIGTYTYTSWPNDNIVFRISSNLKKKY